MTIFPTSDGPLLCLSPQDLPAEQTLTDTTLLPLICHALARHGQAMPLCPELEVFPGREEVLIFVRSRFSLTETEEKPTCILC